MESAVTGLKKISKKKDLSLSCHPGPCWWEYRRCYENFADASVKKNLLHMRNNIYYRTELRKKGPEKGRKEKKKRSKNPA